MKLQEVRLAMLSPVLRKDRLRRTLRLSQQEAVAAATMTGTSDNYLNAFAIFLQANALQMAWLTAVPQIFGALAQILSVWLGALLPRKPLVVIAALIQSLLMGGMAWLAWGYGQGRGESGAPAVLIMLALGYFVCLNVIQPHWRAWMGALVPRRRRGLFFAQRTRLTMVSSLLVFLGGGLLLSLGVEHGLPWLGFVCLFVFAALGRLVSTWLLALMHDPDPVQEREWLPQLQASWQHMRDALHEPVFRRYSLFVACMQGAVAISAPFFSVYMLRDLGFSYLEFSFNQIAFIATQFALLRFWGRFSDRFGNHLVMLSCSLFLPLLPLLWLPSADYFYLLAVQMLSGVAWSGFTLSTANYLYDIRPHQTNFALYAAIQSASSALAVFGGALLGGYTVRHAGELTAWLPPGWLPPSLLFLVFLASGLLRAVVALIFLPRLSEPHMRRRPRLLALIFRVARLNALSGVSLDYMSVTRKPPAGAGPPERQDP